MDESPPNCDEAERWLARTDRDEPLELRITGGSMRPFIRPGCFLSFQRVDPADVEVGDIAMVLNRRSVIVHRVVRREGEMLIMRGDALSCEDEPVPVERVLGRATRLRYGSWAIDLSSRPARVVGRLIARTPDLGARVSRAKRVVGMVAHRFAASRAVRTLRRRRALGVEIWIAGGADLASYEELRRALGSPPWMPRPSTAGTLVLARAGERLVGCTWLVGATSCGTWVRPLWRRLGVGRALLEVAIGDSRDAIEARIAPNQTAAAALYGSLGFRHERGDLWLRRVV